MDFVHDKRVNSLGIIDVLQTTQIRIQKVSTTDMVSIATAQGFTGSLTSGITLCSD
jgi:hypothetical protein